MELFSLLGPFFAIVGLSVLLNFKRSLKMMNEMMDSKSMLFLLGCGSLLLGLWILQSKQIIGWEMWVLCVFGWASVIKGTFMLLFPKILKKTAARMMKGNDLLMQVSTFLITLFGLWLTRLSFMV